MDKVSMDTFLSEVSILSKTIRTIDKKLDINNTSDKVSKSLQLTEKNITVEFIKLQRQNAQLLQKQKESADKLEKGLEKIPGNVNLSQLGEPIKSTSPKQGVLTKVVGQFKSLKNGVDSSKLAIGKLTGTITKGFSKIGLFMSAIKAGTKQLVDKFPWIIMIVSVIAALFKKAWDWLLDLPSKIWSYIEKSIENIKSFIKDGWESVKDFFSVKPSETSTPEQLNTTQESVKPSETSTPVSDIPTIQQPKVEEQLSTDNLMNSNVMGPDSLMYSELPGSIGTLPQVEASQVITDNSVTNVHNVTVTNHSSTIPYR